MVVIIVVAVAAFCLVIHCAELLIKKIKIAVGLMCVCVCVRVFIPFLHSIWCVSNLVGSLAFQNKKYESRIKNFWCNLRKHVDHVS